MKKFKLYWDKDEEQVWLNKMSEEGWAAKNFFLGMYTFEKCEKGEYIYQIDLIKNKNNKEYLEFLKENGVEVVCRWGVWIVLRKKASEGTFELYTDIESKTEQYKKMRRVFFIVLLMELLACVLEVMGAVKTNEPLIWIFAILLGSFVVGLSRLVLKFSNKIKMLNE